MGGCVSSAVRMVWCVINGRKGEEVISGFVHASNEVVVIMVLPLPLGSQ